MLRHFGLILRNTSVNVFGSSQFIFNQLGWHTQRGVQCLIFLTTMVHPNIGDTPLPAYRLPPHLVPNHYDLDIITHLEPSNFKFQGNVRISIECLKPTDVIKVHARNLKFTEDKVSIERTSKDEKQAVTLKVQKTEIDTANEFFVVKTNEMLDVGQIYLLHIPFHGELTENLIGYYRSSYLDRRENSTKWLAVTHFEPTNARQAFPCFDEPDMKATFTIRLGHKETFKSISNMPLLKTLPMEGQPGWVWNEFQPTVPMSTYLIAYMVSEFESRVADSVPNSQVQFRVWARPDAINQSDFAAHVGPRFLSYYEDFFDVSYPLPKQDLLAIPDFKIGAMENWGIITFREAMLLLDEKLTSSPVKLSIANVIAHELAHMWFGNLVTMHWWTDLWLKEGFATYMAGLSVHHEFPEWNSLDASALSNMLLVFKRDSLKTSHPVSVPIHHPNEIDQVFDAISYDKGSFILRMISLFLGEEVFRHGVSEYLKTHQYKNADQDDLWASLTVKAHRYHALPAEITVKQIMDTWTLQTGYPLVTATRNYDNHKITVSQKRMLAVKSDNPEDYKGNWWVPLSYSTANDPQFSQTQPQHWLSSGNESMQFDISAGPEDWFILNNKAAGLYRVNYDNQNWQLLADALHSHHEDLDVLNRAQLVIDSMDLADHGVLDYKLAFKIIGYLRYETEHLPWKAGITKLTPINTILNRTANYGIFKKFVHSLLTPLVKSFGKLTDKPESFEKARLLSLIVPMACPYNLGNWGTEAMELFAEWRKQSDPDTNNVIPKDVRAAVYAHAVREGDEDVWDFFWQRCLNANLSTERNHILRALASTKEIWLLNRYLEWSLKENSGIRKQDAFLVFNLIATQENGFYVAKEFFFKNIKKISSYHGQRSSLIGKYYAAIAEQSISNQELEEFKLFAKNHEDLLAHGSLSVSQSLESLQGNINWMNQHYDKIPALLAEAMGA